MVYSGATLIFDKCTQTWLELEHIRSQPKYYSRAWSTNFAEDNFWFVQAGSDSAWSYKQHFLLNFAFLPLLDDQII